MRPEWIDRETFRQWLKSSALNRMMVINGNQVSTFLRKCAESGRPIRSMDRRWRPVDVWTRAKAEAARIENPCVVVHRVEMLRIERESQRSASSMSRAELDSIAARFELQNRVIAQMPEITRQLMSSAFQMENRLPTGLFASEATIVATAVPWARRCAVGVYFLVKNNEVVYVGQSRNAFARVSTHARDRRMEFDRVNFLPCHEDELNLLESAYIHVLRPRLNGGFGARLPGGKTSKHYAAPMTIADLVSALMAKAVQS